MPLLSPFWMIISASWFFIYLFAVIVYGLVQPKYHHRYGAGFVTRMLSRCIELLVLAIVAVALAYWLPVFNAQSPWLNYLFNSALNGLAFAIFQAAVAAHKTDPSR